MMPDWLVVLHLMALAVGTGLSLANYVSFRVAAGLNDEGRAVLARQRLAVGRIGDAAIALIWLSGLALVVRYTGGAAGNAGALPAAFHAKMVLVLLLTACHAGSRWAGVRIMRQQRSELLPVARACTLGAHVSALGAIVLAVASFR